MNNLLWGIDLGGTKIEGVVLASEHSLEPLCRLRVPTEQEHGYTHIIKQIKLLVDNMSATINAKPTQIGFGTPGASNRSGLLKNSNTKCLNGQPLAQDLETALGVPVIIRNDANCFALTESLFGAAQGCQSVFGVILGTGVGGGIIYNQEVINGYQSIAGEWGHNVLVPDGLPCYCGKRGCVETVIAGPALEKYYYGLSGKKSSLAQINALAVQGDQHAQQTLMHLCHYFGAALATVINILDPEAIVLGGGVSNISWLYSKGIESVRAHVFNSELETKIVKNRLGDSAGVFGAALLTRTR